MQFRKAFRKTLATFMLIGILASLMASCSRKGGCPGSISDHNMEQVDETQG